MSYIKKAEHASDSSTPKTSHTVSDIAVKSRENRCNKPETYYHLSPKPKTDEEDFSLGDHSGELRAEFATKLKIDDPETGALRGTDSLHTLERADDDNIEGYGCFGLATVD